MNVALVGCGRISKKHVTAIEAHHDLTLRTVCDVEYKARDKYVPNTSVGTLWNNFNEMIKADREIDIVSICTPSDLHAEMAIACAEAGKHVMLEKPIALNVEDAMRVNDAVRKNKVKFCVVAQNRFNAPMQDLKEKVDSGDFGEIKIASAVCRWYRPPEYFKDKWQGEMSRSGGVLINQALHHIDALLWLAGPIAHIEAAVDDFEFPKSAVASLRFVSGAIGTLEATVEAYPRNVESSVNLVMEYGTLKVGGHALNKFDTYHTTPERFEVREIPEGVYGHGHIEQYEELVNAIKEDREPSTNGLDAMSAVSVATAMYWKARP